MMRVLAILFGCLLIQASVAKPQISFGEEDDVKVPVKPAEPEKLATVEDNEFLQTRLGLLAGYLSMLHNFSGNVGVSMASLNSQILSQSPAQLPSVSRRKTAL